MKGSIIAILYGLALIVFFVFLVVMTITLIVSKDKKNTGKVKNRPKKKDEFDEDEYYNEDEYYDDKVTDSQNYDYDDSYADDNQGYDYDDSYADDNQDYSYDDNNYDYTDVSDSAFGNIEETPVVKQEPAQDKAQAVQQPPVEEKVPVQQQPSIQEEVPVMHQPPVKEAIKTQQPDISLETAQPEPVTPVTVKEEEVTEEEAEEQIEAQTEEQIQEVPQENLYDSAFAPYPTDVMIDSEELDESVKEAEALGAALENEKQGKPGIPVKQFADSNDDFYWYNKLDVAEKPSYKTKEMYYHYFNLPKDCIEDLLIEMYDCALVRTEELKYIAYGIKPVAVSMKEILTSGNRNYMTQQKIKEPTTQDLVKIYEKWCGYVDKLFEKVEIHADEFTFNEIRRLLYEFGRSDVDILIEGL